MGAPRRFPGCAFIPGRQHPKYVANRKVANRKNVSSGEYQERDFQRTLARRGVGEHEGLRCWFGKCSISALFRLSGLASANILRTRRHSVLSFTDVRKYQPYCRRRPAISLLAFVSI
jgi:hypothetical protein